MLFGVLLQKPKIQRDSETGNSEGFAFVKYASFEASDAAIEAMDGQYLCNKAISVSYILAITNLDPEVDEKLLADTFSPFGFLHKLPKILCNQNPATGNSEGLGFIKYATFEAADTAIKSVNGQLLRKRAISVSHALDAEVEHGGSAANRLLAVQKPFEVQRPSAFDIPEIPSDQDPDRELDSDQFEDISKNDMNSDNLWGCCEKANIKKKCVHLNCAVLGVQFFCDKFCAIRYHAKQKAMADTEEEENVDEELQTNDNDKEKPKRKYKKRKPNKFSRHKKHVDKIVISKIMARRRKTPKDPLKHKSKNPFEDMPVDQLKPFVVSMVESYISWRDPTGIGFQVKQQAYSYVAHATKRSVNFCPTAST